MGGVATAVTTGVATGVAYDPVLPLLGDGMGAEVTTGVPVYGDGRTVAADVAAGV